MKRIQLKPRALAHTLGFQICVIALLVSVFVEVLNLFWPSAGEHAFWNLITQRPLAFLTGYLMILLTFMPIFFLRRRCFYGTLITLLWVVAGSINCFIRSKRQTPFTFSDLTVAKTGLETLPNYLPVFAIILLAIGIVLLLIALVIFFLKGPRNTISGRHRLLSGLIGIAISGAVLSGCWNLAFSTHQLSTHFSNLINAYNDYGFAYCFLQTGLNRGISSPNTYDAATMEEIEQTLAKPSVTLDTDVNIIFVQLESMMDPYEVEGVTLSEDPIPTLHALRDAYSSGDLIVPVIGAGTANTEFEVLTGINSRDFGPGEYPYNVRAKQIPIESTASILSDLGYGTHAVHNHRTAFYNRNTVYANLGFDTFTGVEYMPKTERTPNKWCKDSVLTSQILEAMDLTEDQSDFVFTVTVQCHGVYPTTPMEDPKILVESCPDNVDENALTYYVNQIHDTDQFVSDLISALEARGEKAVVVFYSDHLPALGLEKNQMDRNSLYRTDYVVWDNIGLEKNDEDLYAYQLSAEVLSRLGVSDGVVFRYHQANKNDETYLTDLKTISYDLLYGKQYLYHDDVPQATEIQLGTAEVRITSVLASSESLIVLGDNFNSYFTVTLDGDTLDTTYVSPHMLIVEEKDLQDVTAEDLSICVIDSKHNYLSNFDDILLNS